MNNKTFLETLHSKSDILLAELFQYLNSSELARIYNYTSNGDQIERHNKERRNKVTKQPANTILKWVLNTHEQDIVAKKIILFVDGRRSLVPFHRMYDNQNKSSIFNEDCIHNTSYFNNALSLRGRGSYGAGYILIKPGNTLILPNTKCQPYTIFFTAVLKGSVFLKCDYGEASINATETYSNYYRSNITFNNPGKDIAILFFSVNWLFNNVDLKDNSVY